MNFIMLKMFSSGNSLIKKTLNNFSGAEKIIKTRMKAVRNIGKITKAMKMVASSKMRADIQRLNNGKDFGVHMMPKVFDLDTFSKSKVESFEPQKILMIPITTDRGLCGGINSNTLRAMKEVVL
jgi:F-type H+-transporting ATPase subunit gamma